MKRWLATITIFAAVLAALAANTMIDPTRQIKWTLVTGSGAPGGSCTSSNYGQPYTDTTNNVQYNCSSSGWFTPNGIGGNQSVTITAQTINAGTCIGPNTVTIHGVSSTSVVVFTPNADITGITGWGTTGGGSLVFFPVPSTNTVTWKLCNLGPVNVTTASSVTFNVGAR